METKVQVLGTIDEVKLFFDPLRKEDSFIVMKKSGEAKMGFVMEKEVILETNFQTNWDEISGIIGGFSAIDTFQKIKDKVNEQVQ